MSEIVLLNWVTVGIKFPPMSLACISEFMLEKCLLCTPKWWPICCDICACSVAFLQATSDQCNWSASTDPIDGLCPAIVLDQASGTIFKSVPMLGALPLAAASILSSPAKKFLSVTAHPLRPIQYGRMCLSAALRTSCAPSFIPFISHPHSAPRSQLNDSHSATIRNGSFKN